MNNLFEAECYILLEVEAITPDQAAAYMGEQITVCREWYITGSEIKDPTSSDCYGKESAHQHTKLMWEALCETSLFARCLP